MQVYYLLVCLVLLGVSTSEGAKKDKSRTCRFECSEVKRQVCGSDGITYKSECELKMQNCFSSGKRNVTVDYEGRCEENELQVKNKCPVKECPLDEDKVCGDDGKTYRNLCELILVNCEGKNIRLSYLGKCEKHPVEWKKKYNCGNIICPGILRPVCDSKGKVYGNYCDLRIANCRSDKEIFEMPCNNSGSRPKYPNWQKLPRRPRVKYPKVEVEEDNQMEEEDDDTNLD